MSDALSFADIDGQHVELLPARTVLSLYGGSYPDYSDDGGDGGDGGDHNKGGDGKGGDGGDAHATAKDNVNVAVHNHGDVEQKNAAVAEGGNGGDAKGGNVDADGGDGGDGGDDVKDDAHAKK